MPPPAGGAGDAEGAVGFFLSTRLNDAFRAVNRLLAAGEEVRRLQQPFEVDGATLSGGHVLHPAQASDAAAAGEDRRRAGHAVPRQPSRAGKRSRGRSSRCASACGTATAARCRRAGRAGCWSSSSFRSEVVSTAGAGQGRPARQVRRADLRGRGDSRRAAVRRRPIRGRRPARRAEATRPTNGRRTRPTAYRGRARQRHRGARRSRNSSEFLEDGGTVLTIGSSTSLGQASRPAAWRIIWRRSDEDGKERAAAAREVLRAGVGACACGSTRPIRWPGAWATRWT